MGEDVSETPQGEGWWQASDSKWYPPQTHPDYRPPPPPPSASGPLPAPPSPRLESFASSSLAIERPTATAAFVCGVIGAVIGLIPLLGIVAIPLGILAFVLGLIGWRRKPQRAKLAPAATILGVVAVVLGVIGIAIVADVFQDVEDALDINLDRSPSPPENAIPEYGSNADLDRLADRCAGEGEAAAEACGELWAQAPAGSGYESYGGSCGARPGRNSFTCLSTD
jgi:hypothetical protein